MNQQLDNQFCMEWGEDPLEVTVHILSVSPATDLAFTASVEQHPEGSCELTLNWDIATAPALSILVLGKIRFESQPLLVFERFADVQHSSVLRVEVGMHSCSIKLFFGCIRSVNSMF